MAAQAIMERLKVVFISLEMSKYEVKERIYKRITALGDEKGDYSYPCFDCRKNQDNSCTKSIRTNTVRLLDSNGNKPKFDHRSKYRPCSLCRGSKDFILASWFTSLSRDKMKFTNSNKIIKAMNTMYGNNFRALAYPEYSANVSKFKFDLDRLEEYEGFVPDVIIPDYADIFAPEDSRVTGRDRIDETWKALKNMAGTRHCLVATASQSNRLSMNKENVTVVDAAEDIRKVAHCNLFLALNQKEDEKKDGILRVAKIVARSSNFNPYKSCTVLQNVELGQTILDSEIGVIHKEPLNAIDDKTKKK
jgi:replicative DNA helicase